MRRGLIIITGPATTGCQPVAVSWWNLPVIIHPRIPVIVSPVLLLPPVIAANVSIAAVKISMPQWPDAENTRGRDTSDVVRDRRRNRNAGVLTGVTTDRFSTDASGQCMYFN